MMTGKHPNSRNGFKKGCKKVTNKGDFKKGIHPLTEFKKGQNVGSNHPGWKGGKTHIAGYILIYKPEHPFAKKRGKNGRKTYVREHRLVIEKQIGRYLNPGEEVHHLGKRDDNRPHMLMAFVSKSAHKRFENGHNVNPEEIIFDGRLFNREPPKN